MHTRPRGAGPAQYSGGTEVPAGENEVEGQKLDPITSSR